MRSKIVSIGSYLPDKILTNFDLEKIVDTSNEWIVQRTGIKERHISDKPTSYLAYLAAKKAIEGVISPEEIDVIIVGRGGGSIEDLWAFNEEITARAIYNSKIPIISAVGHETDFTIADFVADIRASTPSNAAEIVVPVKSELIRQLKSLDLRLKSASAKLISNKKNNLLHLIKNIEKVSPKRLVENKKIRINDLVENMHETITRKIDIFNINISHLRKRLFLKNPLNILKERRLHIKELSEKLKKSALTIILQYRNKINTEKKALNSLSPYNVLKRGYSIAFNEKNRVVFSVTQVKENENITLLLSDGRLKTKVLSSEKS
ncbi:exodeoxyribonuclease VII large subunit [Desulfurella sp.]|uniref:exodeoxyribonuclease VII large subunit n=1 Tax=Desulfurella sp. TaxID=1962857 RepID=UPI0025C67989|nr:exodeoxyribonuclease VII large subunit [Desulfurella sp.]